MTIQNEKYTYEQFMERVAEMVGNLDVRHPNTVLFVGVKEGHTGGFNFSTNLPPHDLPAFFGEVISAMLNNGDLAVEELGGTDVVDNDGNVVGKALGDFGPEPIKQAEFVNPKRDKSKMN